MSTLNPFAHNSNSPLLSSDLHLMQVTAQKEQDYLAQMLGYTLMKGRELTMETLVEEFEFLAGVEFEKQKEQTNYG